MKAYMLFTASGPMVVLTSYDSLDAPQLRERLVAKGIDKYIAYPIPLELVQERYGHHYRVVITDLHEADDLRVLDYNGHRAFHMFDYAELGTPEHCDHAA